MRSSDWTTEAIDEALRAKLVDELGLKPRNAFGPVRVAVTGRRVSPPLFESLELLGREESLARLDAAPPPPGRAERCPTRHPAHHQAHLPATRPAAGVPSTGPAGTLLAAADGRPPAPGAAQLSADAAHLGLRLVEADPGRPAGRRRLLRRPDGAGRGAGDRCCRRRWAGHVLRQVHRGRLARHGHPVVDALHQPRAGLADADRLVRRAGGPPAAAALAVLGAAGVPLEVLLRLHRPGRAGPDRLADRGRAAAPRPQPALRHRPTCRPGSSWPRRS